MKILEFKEIPRTKFQVKISKKNSSKISNAPGDFPGVRLLPLKLTPVFFCGVLLVMDIDNDVLNAELYEIEIFDVFAVLALSAALDAFIFFCHLGAGPRKISPSIFKILFISFI